MKIHQIEKTLISSCCKRNDRILNIRIFSYLLVLLKIGLDKINTYRPMKSKVKIIIINWFD